MKHYGSDVKIWKTANFDGISRIDEIIQIINNARKDGDKDKTQV